LDAGAKIIGINNRDLMTLKVDINTSRRLLPLIPDTKIKIVESGINNESDLYLFKGFHVHAFLVGEALVTAEDPGEKLKKFYSVLGKND
jgi:indole-3-glycerol phosphate synthase